MCVCVCVCGCSGYVWVWYVDRIRLYMFNLLVRQLHHAGHDITRIVGLEILAQN